MNENFSYDELREMADMFSAEGRKKLAIEAVSEALEVAGYDPKELTFPELYYLANCDGSSDACRLPKSPALIECVVRELRGGVLSGLLFLKKGHPLRETLPRKSYDANANRLDTDLIRVR